MRRTDGLTLTLLVVLLGYPGIGGGAQPSDLDPAAMAALQRMGAYLRGLHAFQVQAVTTDEDVMDDGEKVQYTGVATLLARAPDRLRAEVVDSRIKRLFLYDGKSFTLFAERVGYYATVPAPPTIAKLIDKLDSDYGWSVPLTDLFKWGAEGSGATAVKRATDVGPSEVEGVTCQQYVLRQDDVDWQIWIQKGDFPLPRKLVITTRSDEARPQHSVVYTWNLAPSFNEAAFRFEAPPEAKRVKLQADSGGAAAAAAKASK